MDRQLLVQWAPFLLVIIAEHIILTRWYHKPSSIQRLVARSSSVKADIAVWSLFYVAWPLVRTVGAVLELSGIQYLALVWVIAHVHWSGLASGIMPSNQVLAVVVWLLAVDFADYVIHVVMHKVRGFWHIHKLHHAATEFNIVTGTRSTIAESLLDYVAIFLMLSVVLGLPNPQVALWVLLIYRIIDLLQHSDLPWDYGLLGYVIASPRFHRMHHSSHPDDFNANYSNIFSFWDYLFGTVAQTYRVSRAAADTRPLGLSDPVETSRYNDAWYLAPLRATGIDYLLERYLRRQS